jgi:CheY-like chemotaxis protein
MDTGRDTADGNGTLVLVAEDNDDQRALLCQSLQLYGYRVLEARDGEEAVIQARDRMPDAVIMDLAMPGIGGIEATRRLKSEERTSGIRIIALTAHVALGFRVQAEAAGCDLYLTKPLLPSEIRRHLEAMLRHPARP